MIARGINRTPPSYRIRNAVDEGRWILAASMYVAGVDRRLCDRQETYIECLLRSFPVFFVWYDFWR
jgi:hypothetical protein